jgi:hypothetical protein
MCETAEGVDSAHSVAAASTAPASLNVFGLEKTISTGYFHSMNLAHPRRMLATCNPYGQHIKDDVPQYAAFLPKYFPKYGTMTMVNKSSNCCNDSFHSLSASDMYSSSSASELVAEDGNESISSGESGSTKLSLLLIDMVAAVLGILGEGWWRYSWIGGLSKQH